MRELRQNALKSLLKEAISLEAKGQPEGAIALFEAVIRQPLQPNRVTSEDTNRRAARQVGR
jgi:hypothetical protein